MAGGELKALRDRLRAASGSDRDLDAEIAAELRTYDGEVGWVHKWTGQWLAINGLVHLIGKDGSAGNFHPAPITANIDAALALCERKLPEWQGVYMTTEWTGYTRPGNGVRCSVTLRRGIHSYIEAVSGDCPTLPLAILIALLGAMIEEETRDG